MQMQCCANIGQYWTTPQRHWAQNLVPILGQYLSYWPTGNYIQYVNIGPIFCQYCLLAGYICKARLYCCGDGKKVKKNYFFRNYFKVLGLLHRAKQTYDLKQNARHCTCDYCVELPVIRPTHKEKNA